MQKEIISEEGNRLFVIGIDMENRSPDEIARDAAMQINDIFKTLLQQQNAGKEDENCDS